jgi:hypothetical protein
MEVSRRAGPRRRQSLTTSAVELAWGAWAELGVSGWAQTHQDWAIDPEPLIVFTAWIGDEEARLRDEATDWCVRNWRFVSKVRLRNLGRQQPEEVVDAFGTFAATVSEHAGIAWPLATEPRRFRTTGRSASPQLEGPSVSWLRLRSIFGLGARAEILRYFLETEAPRASVAAIAQRSGYQKRNVAEECETLHQAGVLSVRTVRNRFYYSLARREELVALVGPLPRVRPDWVSLLDIVRVLVEFEWELERSTSRVATVKARSALRAMEPALLELDIEGPGDDVTGGELVDDVLRFGRRSLGAWSSGSPGGLVEHVS